ncbi:MAG TPA: DedA family protein [Methylovirgula sp.]|jgi:membrane protein DedA with SNARE-associated domain
MLESMGVPVPGETALVAASAYAGATHHLNIFYVIATAASGAIVGDNCGYWIGRTVGAQILESYGRFIGLGEDRLKLARYVFERHGGKVVFFGRFVALLRLLAALLAGVSRYEWGLFLFFNAAGGILWALIFGISAYLFGDAMTRVSGILGLAALGAVVLGVIVVGIVLRRQEKKWEDVLGEQARKKQQPRKKQRKG